MYPKRIVWSVFGTSLAASALVMGLVWQWIAYGSVQATQFVPSATGEAPKSGPVAYDGAVPQFVPPASPEEIARARAQMSVQIEAVARQPVRVKSRRTLAARRSPRVTVETAPRPVDLKPVVVAAKDPVVVAPTAEPSPSTTVAAVAKSEPTAETAASKAMEIERQLAEQDRKAFEEARRRRLAREERGQRGQGLR